MATHFEKTRARNDDHRLYGKVEGDGNDGDGRWYSVNHLSISVRTQTENSRMDE
jgi:hypothetical protein